MSLTSHPDSQGVCGSPREGCGQEDQSHSFPGWPCFFFFFFLNIYLFIYLFIYLWLCWVFVSVRGLSLVVASGGHSSSRCAGLSLSWPLLLRSTGSRCAGSVIVAHRPSCSVACGILPDQGSNPCPLHWQADSQPLRHQGSPGLASETRPRTRWPSTRSRALVTCRRPLREQPSCRKLCLRGLPCPCPQDRCQQGIRFHTGSLPATCSLSSPAVPWGPLPACGRPGLLRLPCTSQVPRAAGEIRALVCQEFGGCQGLC